MASAGGPSNVLAASPLAFSLRGRCPRRQIPPEQPRRSSDWLTRIPRRRQATLHSSGPSFGAFSWRNQKY